MSKGLLITGATGQQGGATIDALLSHPSITSCTILAVTRNPSSPSAQVLTSKAPNIKLIQGDLNDAPALFRTAKAVHPNIWGVFSVQVPMGKGATPQTEETQGKALVDAALANNVQQFVYASIERGGPDSYNNPTPIPHFISKHNIEHHLVDNAKGTDMSYTILRPVAFMENWTPGFYGKMFSAMWTSALAPTRKLQLISTADIGHFAAQAFLRPEDFKNRAIGLAGDEVTFAEANAIWRSKTGASAPATFGFLGAGLLWGVKEVGTMFRWFQDTGYGVDVEGLRKEHDGLLSLGDWIETKSAWAEK